MTIPENIILCGFMGTGKTTVLVERFVRAVLARHNGHRAHAAAQLGLSRQGLAKLLARLGMEESPKR